MRIIINESYQALNKWVAYYVANEINKANPTPEKPYVLGLPTGSSPIGTCRAL